MPIPTPVKDAVKVSRKTFINPSAWFGYSLFLAQIQSTWEMVKGLFTIPVPQRVETFEEAVDRFGLSESDLVKIHRRYLIFAYLFGLLAVISLIAAGYFLFKKHAFLAFVLAITVAMLFLVNGFRYHFWAFQIQFRQLGCSFREWWAGKPFEHRQDGSEQ